MIVSRIFLTLSVFLLAAFTFFAPLKFSVPYTNNIDQSVPQDFLECVFMSWPAEWGLLLLILSALLYAFSRWGSAALSVRIGSLDLCVLLWMLLTLGGFLLHGMRPSGLPSCLLFFGYGLYYFLLRGLETEPKVRETLWLASVMSFVLIVAYGFYQQYEGLKETLENLDKIAMPEGNDPQVLSRLQGKKIFSTFVYSNTLAGYLILWIPMFALVWRDEVKRKYFLGGWMLGAGVFFVILFGILQKFAWAWAYALHLLTLPVSAFYLLFLTRSKGALLSLLIAGAVVGIFRVFGVNRKSLWGFILGGLFLVAALVQTPLGQRLADSWKVRVEYNQASWAMIQAHPWIGTGPGTYGTEYMHYKIPEAEEVQLAHNDFLQMASEQGVLALIAFLGVWGFALKNFLRLPGSALKTGALWALAAAFLHHGMDFDWFVPGLGFFTVFFLSECASLQESRAVPLRPLVHKGLILFAAVTLLLLLGPILRICQGMDWQEKAQRRLQAGNREEGRLCLQNSTKTYPYSAQVWIVLAENYFYSQDFEKAEEAYRKSLDLIPDHAMTWWKLAICMIHQDKKTRKLRDKEVLTALQNAINYYPTHLEIRKYREQYREWLGKMGIHQEDVNGK